MPKHTPKTVFRTFVSSVPFATGVAAGLALGAVGGAALIFVA